MDQNSLQKLHIEPSCITVTTDDLERTYPLDKIGQLQVDSGFDSLGNPIKAKINSRNELLEYKDINCQYDLNGNLIKKITPNKTITYSYDALNRLSAITYDDIKIHFTYDLEGRRLSKEITRNGTLFKKGYYIYA